MRFARAQRKPGRPCLSTSSTSTSMSFPGTSRSSAMSRAPSIPGSTGSVPGGRASTTMPSPTRCWATRKPGVTPRGCWSSSAPIHPGSIPGSRAAASTSTIPLANWEWTRPCATTSSYDLLDEPGRKTVRDGLRRNVVEACHRSYVEDNLVTNSTSNWAAHITSGSIMAQAATFGDVPGGERGRAVPYGRLAQAV